MALDDPVPRAAPAGGRQPHPDSQVEDPVARDTQARVARGQAFHRRRREEDAADRQKTAARDGAARTKQTAREATGGGAKADMRAFDVHSHTHRARTTTFIIPDHCHRGGGRFAWDLRQCIAKPRQKKDLCAGTTHPRTLKLESRSRP